MKVNKLVLLFFSASFIFATCEKKDDDDYTYKTAKLTHGGFDFSEDQSNPPYENADGDIVPWSPVTEVQGNNELWYRPNYDIDADNSQKDMGAVSLESITGVPSSYDADPAPLQKDHCYVVKCLDGYAKFKVLEIPGNTSDFENWWVKVAYEFSEDGHFVH